MAATVNETSVLSSEKLLEHWQGHRRLTRRMIEAFPEDKLFSFSVGSMRPFSEMVKEFLRMAEPIVNGVATGKWIDKGDLGSPRTKAELLALWDRRRPQSIRSGRRYHPIASPRLTRPLANGRVPGSRRFCMRLTMRYTTAVRHTFICERLGSNRRPFMTGPDAV